MVPGFTKIKAKGLLLLLLDHFITLKKSYLFFIDEKIYENYLYRIVSYGISEIYNPIDSKFDNENYFSLSNQNSNKISQVKDT